MENRKKGRKSGRIRQFFKKLGTMDIVLILVFTYLIIFNQQMIWLCWKEKTVPESAWCAMIAGLIGECGICGWIRTTKDKRRDREWEKQDKKESAGAETAAEPPRKAAPENNREEAIINGMEDES